MRRLTKFVLRFYPASWRGRYGVEFDALLEDMHPTWRTALDVFGGAVAMHWQTFRGGWTVALAGLVGLLLGAGCWLVMPNQYRSTATLAVASDNGLVSDQDVADIVTIFLTGQPLGEIIRRDKLYPQEQTRMPLDDVVAVMAKNIHVRPAAGKLLMVQFDYSDPVMAQRVINELVDEVFHEWIELSLGSGSTRSHEIIRLMDSASTAKGPISPNPMQLAMVGLAGGCMLGFVIAFMRRQTSVTAG
jgi:capsular polysaccharide biosynthesis protein